jgi:two-component system, sensor histidine kinase PdtaS
MSYLIDFLPRIRDNYTFKYAFCIAAFLLALIIRLMLDKYLPPGFPFLTFFPAVILSTFVAGLWPGIVSAVACGLAALYFFISPIHSFELTYGGTIAMIFYTFVVGIDIGLIHFVTQALEQLRIERNRSANLSLRMEILFSELQHRVSNNLQTVAGLLLLRESAIDDPEAQRALQEARNRITLLGKLHRKLHDPNLDSVNLGIFLKELCRDVMQTSGVKGVEFFVDTCDVVIPARKFIPLALIVTELLSNSLEHGFANGRNGTVQIACHPDGVTDEIALTVNDDGHGLPPDFNLQTTKSLGLHIAKSLAEQIGGRLSMMASNRGTQCTLHFPVSV